jgi:exonuclease SbcC
MILKTLQMKNFRSYEDSKIDFINGYNIIIGPNGAGKTTIFLAILFALFGRARKDGKEILLSDLVRHGKKKTSVVLEFQLGKTNYIVKREIDVDSGSSSAELYKNNSLISEKSRTVSNDIESIINIDKNTFENILYIGQGEIPKISSDDPAARKKLFDRFLGLDSYDWAFTNLRDVKNHFIHELELLEQKKELYEEHLKVLPEKNQEINRLQEHLNNLINEKKSIELELNKKEKKFSELDEIKKKLDILERDIKNYENSLNKIQQQIKEKSEKIEKGINKKLILDLKHINEVKDLLHKKQKKIHSDIITLQLNIDYYKEIKINIDKINEDLDNLNSKKDEIEKEIDLKTEKIKKKIIKLKELKRNQWLKYIN